MAEPIALEFDVPLSAAVRELLNRRLCEIHGFPAGVPYDADVPPALREAAHRLNAGRRLVLLADVAADGSLSFRLP
jgi:hypothetical protein